MMRFFLTTAFALALALPGLAQLPPRPRESDDLAKLRDQVRDLEAKLKKESGKKDEKDDEKKGEKKKDEKKGDGEKKNDGDKQDEPKRPMGGGFTGGGLGLPSGPNGFPWGNPGGTSGFGGAFGSPMGRGGEGGRGGAGDRPAQSGMGGPDFTRMPGFDKLTKDEQKMLTALVAKMRTPTPAGEQGSRGGGDVEARLDRLEKAIEEIKGLLRGPMPGGPMGPGGRGPGSGGPGGAPGAGGGRPGGGDR